MNKEVKVFKRKCSCGKEFAALKETQVDYYYKTHQLVCKEKNKKEE